MIGLSIRGGVKVYPGTRALKGVDFDLHMGAVNVLVGENGAGKSTLMKVIAGVESLTEGRIEMGGKAVAFRSKEDAVKAGIGIVFQELNLFPNLTVAENIFIGREPRRAGIDIDRTAQNAATRALMARLEQKIDPETPLENLKVGQQQIVEIAKALAQDAKILILDEPTSALSGAEVEVLFRLIADLKRQGVGIVYISHRLEELIRVGDHITVLRDGEITGTRTMEGVDIPWIVHAMIGDKTKEFPRTEAAAFGPEVFRAEDIRMARTGGGWAVDGVSLSLRKSEILGLYGLMGAGRTEFLECIMAQHPHSGRFFIDGQPLTGDVATRIAKGVALIPEDRKRDGLVQIMAIRENLTLSALPSFAKGFHLSLKAEAAKAVEFVKRLTIKVASPENPVSSLSGGNQQKVVIGNWLNTQPQVMFFDEPSRGVDVQAKRQIFDIIWDQAERGLAAIFVSTELEEVLEVADRILVMRQGRIVAEVDPTVTALAELYRLCMEGPIP